MLTLQTENETRNHLFFECSYSKKIWQQVLGLCRFRRDVLVWSYELRWAVQKLKEKSLISLILRIGWNAYIYQIWKERNNRIFKQKEEKEEQILEHIKTAVRYRIAALSHIVVDSVNLSLHDSWGLFDSMFVAS